MHGLIIRSIHCFFRDSHGPDLWHVVAKDTRFASADIDVLRSYPDANAEQLMAAASRELGQPMPDLLEDLGVYLASHESCSNVRRLLRFGGDSFFEFLYSLPELRERARFAVENLELPRLELRQHYAGSYSLSVVDGLPGWGHVIAGVLRAMADDYGALVMLENVGKSGQAETISIRLLEVNYSSANAFNYAGSEAPA